MCVPISGLIEFYKRKTDKFVNYFGYLSKDCTVIMVPEVGDKVNICDDFYYITEYIDGKYIVCNETYSLSIDETQLLKKIKIKDSMLSGSYIDGFLVLGYSNGNLIVSDSNNNCYYLDYDN